MDPRVNGERLWQSLMTMAQIGATAKGGVNRQTLTDEDKRGRDLFHGWCEEAGLAVTVDRMGSMFGYRRGRDPDRPPVALGSHLDSQPTGGKFDGALGVLAALEVVRTLNDRGIETEAPLEVVNWTNEEGVRFAPAMIASGVFAGVFDLDYALARADREGRTIGAELRRIGYAGERQVGHRPLDALFELHIEQGPILEAEGKRIGVVTGGQGTRWYDVEVIGAEAHAGPTPMPARRDPLRAAAELLGDIYRIAEDRAPDGRATVGEMRAFPGSRNTVPGRVEFTIDLRHPDGAAMDAMDHALREAFEQARGRAAGVELHLHEIWYAPPVAFDPDCIDAVRRAAAGLGLSSREIVSGAGHDAVYMARVVPTAMIFVPCKDGISHNEAEYASPQACEDGANVLLHAALARANA
ncbi:MAG TPA: Zn-dependent hydrolase [Geminicoccaceae bacterium]|nr:Zn-dependent hydrolase [Geminicoccaceae bacterium]